METTQAPQIIPMPSEIIPTPAKKRGRPPKAPGAPKAKYNRRSPKQTPPAKTAEEIPAKRDKGVLNSITPPTAEKTPAEQQTDKWTEILAEKEKGIEKVLQTILPNCDLARMQALTKLIVAVSEGEPWDDASQETGLTWPVWNGYLQRYALIRDLWASAQASGESWRLQRMERAIFRRGCDGWTEFQYNKAGELVGEIRRFSDKCAELYLRAANPAKYAPTGDSGSGTQVQVNVVYHVD